jgi:hypothetical protein
MSVILELEKKLKNIMVCKLHNKLSNMPYYKNYAASSGMVHNFANQEQAVKCIFESENFTEFIIKQQKEPKQPKKTKEPKQPKKTKEPKQPKKTKEPKQPKKTKQQKEPKSLTVLTPPTKKNIQSWIQNSGLSGIMPVNTFMFQPCGSQDSPDFIIKFIDKSILAIECKSIDNNTCPLYNSGGIKSNYFYVFSSKITNQTALYMGYNIITKTQQKLIDEHIEESRLRDEILNKKLRECDTNKRGVCYYTRPMIGQCGGAEYTNYFTHVNREQDCKSVFEFTSK